MKRHAHYKILSRCNLIRERDLERLKMMKLVGGAVRKDRLVSNRKGQVDTAGGCIRLRMGHSLAWQAHVSPLDTVPAPATVFRIGAAETARELYDQAADSRGRRTAQPATVGVDQPPGRHDHVFDPEPRRRLAQSPRRAHRPADIDPRGDALWQPE